MEKSKESLEGHLQRRNTSKLSGGEAPEGLQSRKDSSKKKPATLANLRKQETADGSSFEMRTGEGSMRQRLIDSKFKPGGPAPDEMSFDQGSDNKSAADGAESEYEEEEDGYKRHALYLDDKRFVVLIMVSLAGLANFVGFNVIQEYRKLVSLLINKRDYIEI